MYNRELVVVIKVNIIDSYLQKQLFNSKILILCKWMFFFNEMSIYFFHIWKDNEFFFNSIIIYYFIMRKFIFYLI